MNQPKGPHLIPKGFTSFVSNIGIKDSTDDFLVIVSHKPASAAAVFTQSRFAGASVLTSRRSAADGTLRAFAVISKNANVATGKEGQSNADEVVKSLALTIGCNANDIILSSTGVIGRQYPMDLVRVELESLRYPFNELNLEQAATAIMTTDTVPKIASARIGDGPAVITGIAKGVGMIEPNMATLITLFMTDAKISPGELRPTFKAVIDKTFNCLSIDSDTSTSDTAAIMANGEAGFVDKGEFLAALQQVALSLTRQIARDGEGATKLLVVTVNHSRDDSQAKRVAKSILNSPLVKTAVHGSDPNWGRVAMAIGKNESDSDISPDRVTISFGDMEVFPNPLDDQLLTQLALYMSRDEVHIVVDLGTGNTSSTVYGCDLSAGYVSINADYTT